MRRSQLREHIFVLVFMIPFRPEEEMEKLPNPYLESLDPPAEEGDRAYIEEKFSKLLERLPEIDALINEKSKGWSMDRMGRVELSLIRLGAYEILYDEDVPVGVAINEAVELAKKYGPSDAPAFVNGILAKFVPEEE